MRFLRFVCLFAGALAAPLAHAQINGTLVPTPKQQFLNSVGQPLAGGSVYTYAAGTSTPLATYTDSTLATPNANPVVLDSAGRAQIWLGASPYKVTLKDASSNVIWTVDNVTDLALVLKTALAGSAGSGMVGYNAGVTGSVTLTAKQKQAQTVNIQDFGALCNSTHDDTAAINAAIAYVANAHPGEGGGVVHFGWPGAAYCMISSTIVDPAGIIFEGNGPIATVISALPGGTWATYYGVMGPFTHMVGLADGFSDGSSFGAGINNLQISANNYVQTGLAIWNCQELCDIHHISIIGYTVYGIDGPGGPWPTGCTPGVNCLSNGNLFAIQNSHMHDLAIGPTGASATTSIGINWWYCNSRCSIENVTIQASNNTPTPIQNAPGIYLAGSHVVLSHVHCEYTATCVQLLGGPYVLNDIDDSGSGTVATTVLVQPNTSAVLVDILSVSQSVCDQTISGTGTCNGASGVTSINGAVYFHTTATLQFNYFDPDLGLQTPHVNTGLLNLTGPVNLGNGQTVIDTDGNGAFLAASSTNPYGIQIQSKLTPVWGSRNGCGADISGGGFAGDPSMGAFVAGGVYDGGTLAPCAPTTMAMIGGGGLLTFEGSTGNTATLGAVAVMNNGTSGCTSASATVSGGGGTGATATPTITGGVITGYVVGSPGTGYTSTPTITVSYAGCATAPTASAAIAWATVSPTPVLQLTPSAISTAGSTGVTGSTCTAWKNGLCIHL